MISGIIAQVETIAPRGALGLTRCYSDYEKAFSPFIAFDVGGDQLLSAAFVPETESIFAAVIPKVLNAGFVTGNDLAFAPTVTGDQVLAPMIYFAGDVLSLGSVAQVVPPGSLWPSRYDSDDAIYVPIVSSTGLRPSLVGDLETLFAPELTVPLTLLPGRHTNSDSLPTPIVRQNIMLASLVNDADVIYAATRSNVTALSASFVIDGDVSYAPAVGRILGMSLVASDDVIYQSSETGGNKIIAPDLLNDLVDQEVFFAISVSGTPASFDGTSVAVTLSPNKLTATRNSTTTAAAVRSTSQKTAGKYYFEVTLTTTHGDDDCCGLISSTGSFNNMILSGIQCTIIYKANGAIYSNSANSGKSLGTCVSGDVISFAVDLGARKAWFSKNGGLWNGLVLTSENPNIGVGGVTVQASSLMGPSVGFGGANGAINDSMTANFGGTPSGTPFVYTPPVGFGIWTT